MFWSAFAQRDPQRNRDHIAKVLALIERGQLRPHIDATLPLERAAEALERLARRQAKGKLVLVP